MALRRFWYWSCGHVVVTDVNTVTAEHGTRKRDLSFACNRTLTQLVCWRDEECTVRDDDGLRFLRRK